LGWLKTEKSKQPQHNQIKSSRKKPE